MFQLKICGLDEVEDAIVSFAPTHMISAIQHMPLRHDRRHLHVAIADVPRPAEGHVHPTQKHLQQVLDFTADLTDDDRLLTHCYAGQSRSTAYAIAVLIQHGMDPRAAFDHVSAMRAILLPNTLIVQQIDAHFGLHGGLIDLIHAYHLGYVQRVRAIAQANRGQTIKDQAPSQANVDWMKTLLKTLG